MFASRSDLPAPVFAGFFPKITAPAPPDLAAAGVIDVASVSECISSGPDGWIDQWRHNTYGFYDTEDDAVSIIPMDRSSEFDLYAYELFPVAYTDKIERIHLDPAPGGRPFHYTFLGYDIVTKTMGMSFECSPLSCNSAAATFRVNEHCLITNLGAAFAAFQTMGERDSGYEPGPYYLIAVYRAAR